MKSCLIRPNSVIAIRLALLMFVIVAAGSIARAESDAVSPRPNKLALQLNLLGRGIDNRYENYGSHERDRSLNSRLQLGGLWYYDTRAVQIAGTMRLASVVEDYADQSHHNGPNETSEHQSNGSWLRGTLSGALLVRYYPGSAPAALMADGSVLRAKGTEWSSYLSRSRYSNGSHLQYDRITHRWHDKEATVGLGFGVGRIRTLPDRRLTSLAEDLFGSGVRPLSDVVDAIAFQRVQRQPQQQGYLISFRIGSITERARTRSSGTSVSQSVDSAYGNSSRGGSYNAEGRGWTDEVDFGPQAEYHRPIGESFQVDAWGKAEWDLEYPEGDPTYQISVRGASQLSPRFRLELWGFRGGWSSIQWEQWLHARLGYDVNRLCETHAAVTYGYYRHYDSTRILRLQIGLTIWLSGQLDQPPILFPSVAPDWLSNSN